MQAALIPKNSTGHREPFPTRIRTTAIAGLVVTGALAMGLGGWAAWAELASAVIAPAQLKMSTNSKPVRHLTGGTVQQIMVENGDAVAAGQVLLRLDDRRLKAELAIVQQRLDLSEAIEARLLAERVGDREIAFPDALLARRAEAYVGRILENQNDLFEARQASLDGELDVNRQRIRHTEDEIAALNSEIAAKRRETAIAEQEQALFADLFVKKLIPISNKLRAERLTSSLEADIRTLEARVARAQKAASEARLQIVQAQRTQREKIELELRDARAELFGLREQHSATRAALDAMAVKAPEAGIIAGRTVDATGAVIEPGGIVLTLVPSGDEIIVEAYLEAASVDNVSIGQSAEIRLTSLPQRTTPTLQGHLTYVAADITEDPRTGERHYLARVRIPEQELGRLGGVRLQPGMPADIAINTGERTVLDYLVQPLRDSLFKGWRET